MPRHLALATACLALALGVFAAGCGEGGVSPGATVSVYVSAPLCRGARRELAGADGRAGELRVRAVCLDPVERNGHADLAAAGADARRATEDSTAIAYLESRGPAARFSQPIVESADIAFVTARSGGAAMRRVLDALARGDTSSPRSAVREALAG